MDRIDRDALARRQDADDALAGHRAALRREANGQIAANTADRNGVLRVIALAKRLEHQAGRLVEAEPAAVALRRRGASGALVLEVWMNGAHHVARIHLAPPNRDKDV